MLTGDPEQDGRDGEAPARRRLMAGAGLVVLSLTLGALTFAIIALVEALISG